MPNLDIMEGSIVITAVMPRLYHRLDIKQCGHDPYYTARG